MRLRILIIAGFVLATFPVPGKGGVIGLYSDTSGSNSHILDVPSVVEIHVVLSLHLGATAVQFAAPLPDCFVGATYLSDTQRPIGVTIGNSQSGVAVGFGACSPPPVYVLTINVFAQGLTDSCCLYPVLPHPDAVSGEIEMVDCSSTVAAVINWPSPASTGQFGPPAIVDRDPPDAATDQPRTTTLNWTAQRCNAYWAEVWHDVFFGTDADPPLVAQYTGPPYDPGPLQYGTTYYWKVIAVEGAGSTETPVWSFTTETSLATRPSTWGRIKALYVQ